MTIVWNANIFKIIFPILLFENSVGLLNSNSNKSQTFKKMLINVGIMSASRRDNFKRHLKKSVKSGTMESIKKSFFKLSILGFLQLRGPRFSPFCSEVALNRVSRWMRIGRCAVFRPSRQTFWDRILPLGPSRCETVKLLIPHSTFWKRGTIFCEKM